MCLKNCTCTACANSDIKNGGSGCLLWFGDLVDVKEYEKYNYEQPVYLRLSASELGNSSISFSFPFQVSFFFFSRHIHGCERKEQTDGDLHD